jgi:pimeloyl-ACP methyl ester carboxylesterase
VPVVVFLHGVNESRRLHPRLSSGDDDLRKVVDALVASGKTTPLVLAAPTHSKDAQYTEVLFPGFDLDAFVDATQAALPDGVRVDRGRVVVVGHSGGACNPQGGLLAVAKKRGGLVPLALVESDGCMDAYVADALKQAPEPTRVHVYWQTWMWPRRFDAFREQLSGRSGATLEVIGGLMDGGAHDRMAELVLGRALPRLLPR